MNVKKAKKRDKALRKAILETRDMTRQMLEIERDMLAIAVESMEMTRYVVLGVDADAATNEEVGG